MTFHTWQNSRNGYEYTQRRRPVLLALCVAAIGCGDNTTSGVRVQNAAVNESFGAQSPEVDQPPDIARDAQRSALPVGMAALTDFESLPYLRLSAQALGFSSGDPRRLNADWSNYRSDDGTTKTAFDAIGPGVVYRWWHTYDTGFVYHLYFDGETTPSLNLDSTSLWSGSFAPFAPLTWNTEQSSGGAVTYFPVAFAKSLRITVDGPGLHADYYDFNYTHYSDDASIQTYTGREDPSAAANAWQRVGQNPIAARADDVTTSISLTSLATGETALLARLDGPQEIVGLQIDVPQISDMMISDDGRGFGSAGSSTFTVAIDPANTGVRLLRRSEHGSGGGARGRQTATVSVDGSRVAAQWQGTAATPIAKQWSNESFELPADMTAGKSRITITVAFVSADRDWNEFRYWVYSTTSDAEDLTDMLDVGNANSESAHAYQQLGGLGFLDMQTAQYSPLDDPQNTVASLAHARLQIFWDAESQAGVDAPLTDFFASGANQVTNVLALPLGSRDIVDYAAHFYCYFPMPFQNAARVVISNEYGHSALNQLHTHVVSHRFTGDFDQVGYFRTQYRAPQATVLGHNYDILNIAGSGHYVGMTLSFPNVSQTLEGNEEIYVDGSRSPAIAGSGTEDYFNAGYYFLDGAFSLPTHGASVIPPGTTNELTASVPTLPIPFSAYRFHISDLIPFRTGIRVSMQHGPTNDNVYPYSSVAYYYGGPQLRLKQTDAFSPGDSRAAVGHHYRSTVGTFTKQTARFFSDDPTPRTFAGMNVTHESEFAVKIEAANHGVILRRLSNASIAGQKAKVSIDGADAGIWYAAGQNAATYAWKEDDFFIAPALTQGKTKLDVHLTVESSMWTEYQYQAFAQN